MIPSAGVGSRDETLDPNYLDLDDLNFSRNDQLRVQQICAYYISKPLINICKAPLGRITILFQVQGMYGAMSKPSLSHEFSRIVKEEGFKGLWRGNLISTARGPPWFAINYLATRYLINQLKSVFREDCPGTKLEVFLWSTVPVLSMIVSSSAIYPMDLVRTRLAAQRSKMYYNGIWHAFSTIYREEGLLGLYKGNGASVLRKAPKIAIYAYACELLTSSWESQRPNDSIGMITFSSIGICGLISSMATFPIDLVRKRLQLDGAGGQAKIYNTGLFGTFTHIFKTEGPRGLYRGVLPGFLKAFPRAGLFFMTLTIIKRNDMFAI